MQLRVPATDDEYERYYLFRWRLLRGPWGEPRGSEQDEHETSAHHLMVCADDGNVIGVGRVHFNTPGEAQIRYMAVDEDCRGQGIGRALLERLEETARQHGAVHIMLNARKPVAKFYEKLGYRITGDAHTLFKRIPHVHMEKDL